MSEPIPAEWASGRRQFSLALLMFWLGGFWLAASLIIGVQAMAVPRMAKDLGQLSLIVPVWAVVTIALSLLLRRSTKNKWLAVFSLVWLVLGAGGLVWVVQPHA